MTYDAIRLRLATKGITICKQRISAILQNPFYCGLLSHKMLQGELVQGNHEPLVSRELFLRVNGLLQHNHHGYSIQEENEHLPLKCFLKCEKCGKHMHGYIVKKKGIHYYKCSTKGCGTNRNAQVLNHRFAELLGWFSLDFHSDVLKLVKQQAVATFNQYTKGYQDEYAVIEDRLADLNRKISRLEERYMEEEIAADLYSKYFTKYNEEKQVIEQELEKETFQFSNLDKCIETASELALNMPKKWVSADFSIKQRLQNLLFPEGILYDRVTDTSRTTRVNFVFLYIAYLKQVMTKKERGIPALQLDYASLSRSVAGAGLEPTTFGL